MIDNIKYRKDRENANRTEPVSYNNVQIERENVKQYLPLGQRNDIYECVKLNGTTYYLDEIGQRIIARLNDTTLTIQCSVAKNGQEEYDKWKEIIQNNSLAQDYYKDAYVFTDWFKSSGLQELKYSDAIDTIIDEDGNIRENQHIWASDSRTIFDFNNSNTDFNKNIENESSSFNEHRLAIIRHKIEVNLAIAITNYNAYSGTSNNVFQLPKLSENEWDSIIHNISLISFMQGMSIGGKVYNGYSIVTNSESKEVVLENNIYILGTNKDGKSQYYKIGDHGLSDETVNVTAGVYAGNGSQIKSAGRINIEFERGTLNSADGTKKYYYYPLAKNNASYNSVIMQNDVNTYDDIYEYVNGQSSNLKIAFYTALGRERASTYKAWSDYVDTSLQIQTIPSDTGNTGGSGENVTPVETHTITYKNNGTVFKTSNVKYGENHTVANAVSLAGKVFKGWSDGIKIYQPGDIINNITKDIILNAVYEEPTTTFEIVFNPNGGNWNGSTQARTITASSGSNTKLQPNGGNPQRTGYTFKGWATSQSSANNGKIDYEPNSTYTGNNSLTLWAVWTANKTEETGGSGNTGTTEYKKGDINGDGKVDQTDYNLLLRYVFMGQSLTDEQKKRADINGDGKINYSDLSALRKLM